MPEASGRWRNPHQLGRNGHAGSDTPLNHRARQHQVPSMEEEGLSRTQVGTSQEIFPRSDQRRRGAEQAHNRRGRPHSKRRSRQKEHRATSAQRNGRKSDNHLTPWLWRPQQKNETIEILIKTISELTSTNLELTATIKKLANQLERAQSKNGRSENTNASNSGKWPHW